MIYTELAKQDGYMERIVEYSKELCLTVVPSVQPPCLSQ